MLTHEDTATATVRRLTRTASPSESLGAEGACAGAQPYMRNLRTCAHAVGQSSVCRGSQSALSLEQHGRKNYSPPELLSIGDASM